MKYKFFLLLSVAFVSFTGARGQTVILEAYSGYSSYQMKDLRELLEVQIGAVQLPVRITENFPAYFHAGFQVGVISGPNETGFRYGHYSTGGRVHYRDYSGEYGFDVNMSAHALGFFTRMVLLEEQRFQLKASIGGLVYQSYGRISNYLRVGKDLERFDITVASTSFVLEPSVVPTFYITDLIYVGAQLGLALDMGGGLHLAGDRKAKLKDDNNDPINTSWYGLRSEVSIGIRLWPD